MTDRIRQLSSIEMVRFRIFIQYMLSEARTDAAFADNELARQYFEGKKFAYTAILARLDGKEPNVVKTAIDAAYPPKKS